MPIAAVMTPDPSCCPATTSLADAARMMRDDAIGDVLVCDDDDRLVGIVTDRDLVVRGLAAGNVEALTLGDICTNEVVTVRSDAPTGEVVRLMSDRAVRRMPVVEDGKPVGIVSLGDLAERLDQNSVLGQISAAPPDS